MIDEGVITGSGLTWRPETELWPVKVDPSQIDQILANFCVNARDAISGIGKMTIETGNSTFTADYCAAPPGFVPGEYVRLAVNDTGCGIDRKTLARIIEPFFTTKGVGLGTGLGLATVYARIALWRSGQVGVEIISTRIMNEQRERYGFAAVDDRVISQCNPPGPASGAAHCLAAVQDDARDTTASQDLKAHQPNSSSYL